MTRSIGTRRPPMAPSPVARRDRLRRIATSAALVVAGCGLLQATARADVPGAMSAITAGDCKAAGASINEGLQREDAQAYFLAGFLYDRTGCVANDPRKAERLYRRAAALGDHEAAVYLGFLYGFGRGVPQDYARAHRAFVGADVDTTAPGTAEDVMLGYVETLDHLAELQVAYPSAANAVGIEASFDVVVEPATGALAFDHVKVGTEVGSNVARPYAFTDLLEDAYRSALAMAPKPIVEGTVPARYVAPWQFLMRRGPSGGKVRREGYATVGPASAVH